METLTVRWSVIDGGERGNVLLQDADLRAIVVSGNLGVIRG